jgi:hypothetical protein
MTRHYPPARQRPVGGIASDPRILPVGIVFHVAVSEADSLHGYFDGPSKGIESHLYLRYDGTWEQYRDLDHEADAQGAGNSWISGAHRYGFISVETEGMGHGEWTADQMRAIKEFILWAHHNLSIPLEKADFPQPTSLAKGGIGFHALHREWNKNLHTCPGPQRIHQFNDVILPWMRGLSTPAHRPAPSTLLSPQEDDDMVILRHLTPKGARWYHLTSKGLVHLDLTSAKSLNADIANGAATLFDVDGDQFKRYTEAGYKVVD